MLDIPVKHLIDYLPSHEDKLQVLWFQIENIPTVTPSHSEQISMVNNGPD